MAEEKKEIGKQCGECKKALNPAKRYYRDNQYYCNKNCYNKIVAKIKEEAAKTTEEVSAA